MKTRDAMQRRGFTLGLERQVASSSSHRNIHLIDEEITIAYLDPFLSRDQRQYRLRDYGFTCTCLACDDSSAKKNTRKAFLNRYERLCRLYDDLHLFFQRNLSQRIVGPLNTCLIDSCGVELPFQALKEVADLASSGELAMALGELDRWCVYIICVGPI